MMRINRRRHTPLVASLQLTLLLAIALPWPSLAQSSPPPAIAPAAPLDVADGPSLDDYVLGAGDRLSLEVFRIPEYSGDYEVLVSGQLSLPMIGQVAVAGLTLEQAQNTIAQAYAARLRRPIVNLVLLEPRPLRIGIAGEVTNPGSYTLAREGTQFPALATALENAGGITQSADLRQITITRLVSGGRQRVIVANLWDFLQTGDLRHNIDLRDGDTVFVPTRTDFNPDES
ncbi:MAG TPA: polysaccharide biosynthesis/export family protein, partial [Candidatus Obscuribacterales bacterium]